jgi:hypothetical protein
MRNRWILAAAVSASLATGIVLIARAADKEEKEGDEQKIELKDAPQAVQDALKKEMKDGKLESIDKQTEDGKTIYEADAMIDGKSREIRIDAEGKVISNKLDEDQDAEKEKDEQKVSLDQVPAAVKATFAKESDGAEVKEVEKETEDGKAAYETTVSIKGKEYEIKVAEDGTLLKKKLEAGETDEHKTKEKDEDDEKEEHHEKK